LRDGLSGILVDLGGDGAGVVFSSHGVSHFGGFLRGGLLLAEELGRLVDYNGRCEGRCTGNKGSEDEDLGLQQMKKRTDKDTCEQITPSSQSFVS
jgi:hypothetical protein